MEWTGLNELREKYLSFFESKGHLRLDSFPLVPNNDNSLLLINSGMAPMKKWFLGQEEPPRHRVTTCQKCIRTPDIERVYDIWTKEVGIDPSHMVRFGKEDNFWEHGSGPCGPCSEIYFDRGPEHGCGKPDCKVGCDCDRYMEVWNLVFSQFDSDGKGTYTRLERPNIDTGMGLERLACVMQGVGNLFEVDTVHNILNHVERITGKTYGRDHATISAEEERFSRTIDQGLNILSNLIDNIEKAAAEGKRRVLAGIDAFKLNDTFGFPLDLTKEIAAENGIEVDEDSFRTEMQKQREKARKDRLSRDISGWTADLFGALDASATEFLGYGTLEAEAKIVALSDGDELTDAVSTDDGAKEGVLVVLDRTPFYAESGGQVADTGVIATAGGAHLAVTACKKTPKGYYVHTCTLLDGVVQAGDKVIASVERDRRHAIMRNHTGAHLLQKALREVLGAHVHQAGSYEDDERVRFDFTHFNAVTPQELAEVERIVNAKIFEALPVHIKVMPLKEAKELGAMALFGEKYGDIVRVVDVEGFSTEFCGGTHVSNTAELGCFKILSESSVAAGIRRIEGTTGYGVLRLLDEKSDMLNQTAGALKVSNIHDLPARAAALTAELRSVQKELDDLKQRQTAMKASGLFEDAKDVDGIKIFTMYLTGTATDALRKLCDNGAVR